jgi:light-regulated signal transduction histidine kinase (bacteriophytochrome)
MSDADRTRIAALEAELAALRAVMQEFTYTVSHDLRAPLRHIVSYVQLVQEDAGPLLPDEVARFLTVITDSANHLGLLIDGLTELSRLGTAPVQWADVPLSPLLQDLTMEFSRLYPQRAIAWKVPPDLPAVWADAALLRRALHCLLDNAVKFSAACNPSVITVSALTRLVEDGRKAITLSIQDEGVGFNPALQSKLFKPFQRLHSTKQFPGIGMGLALAHKIAQRLNGSLSAHAEVSQGCEIRMTLGSNTP